MIHVVGLKLYMWGIASSPHPGSGGPPWHFYGALSNSNSTGQDFQAPNGGPPYIMYISFYSKEDSNLLQFSFDSPVQYIWQAPILFIQHSWYIWDGRSGILMAHIGEFGWLGWLVGLGGWFGSPRESPLTPALIIYPLDHLPDWPPYVCNKDRPTQSVSSQSFYPCFVPSVLSVRSIASSKQCKNWTTVCSESPSKTTKSERSSCGRFD